MNQQLWLLALSAILALAASATATTEQGPPGKYWVYIGTGTGGKQGSKGIYRCELDTANGKLTNLELAAEAAQGQPS